MQRHLATSLNGFVLFICLSRFHMGRVVIGTVLGIGPGSASCVRGADMASGREQKVVGSSWVAWRRPCFCPRAY